MVYHHGVWKRNLESSKIDKKFHFYATEIRFAVDHNKERTSKIKEDTAVEFANVAREDRGMTVMVFLGVDWCLTEARRSWISKLNAVRILIRVCRSLFRASTTEAIGWDGWILVLILGMAR